MTKLYFETQRRGEYKVYEVSDFMAAGPHFLSIFNSGIRCPTSV